LKPAAHLSQKNADIAAELVGHGEVGNAAPLKSPTVIDVGAESAVSVGPGTNRPAGTDVTVCTTGLERAAEQVEYDGSQAVILRLPVGSRTVVKEAVPE
jgi:hypothetical protein